MKTFDRFALSPSLTVCTKLDGITEMKLNCAFDCLLLHLHLSLFLVACRWSAVSQEPPINPLRQCFRCGRYANFGQPSSAIKPDRWMDSNVWGRLALTVWAGQRYRRGCRDNDNRIDRLRIQKKGGETFVWELRNNLINHNSGSRRKLETLITYDWYIMYLKWSAKRFFFAVAVFEFKSRKESTSSTYLKSEMELKIPRTKWFFFFWSAIEKTRLVNSAFVFFNKHVAWPVFSQSSWKIVVRFARVFESRKWSVIGVCRFCVVAHLTHNRPANHYLELIEWPNVFDGISASGIGLLRDCSEMSSWCDGVCCSGRRGPALVVVSNHDRRSYLISLFGGR